MPSPEVSIPPGSLILITGATGHVAAHTVRHFLERGYRVRGTVRNLHDAAWLNEDVFKASFETCLLELVQVPDLGAKDAFNQVIRGASAVVHIASILTFAGDTDQVIRPVVNCVTSLLEAALDEPSVKSFVYTSSIAAAVDYHPGVTAHVGRNSWNNRAVEVAYSQQGDTFAHGHAVYQASKVEAEKAVWGFTEKHKPRYSVSVVSPATVLGEALTKRHLVTPYPWIKNLYYGNEEIGALFQAIIHVDVKDVALLHVAAVLDPGCDGARLQAWGELCNMNDILAILRRMHSSRQFMEDFPNQTKLGITTDDDQELALLKKWGGQNGWRTLEQSVADEMEGVRKWCLET